MGLNIAALIVDWKHLEEIPIGRRLESLYDASYPDDEYEDVTRGWWPPLTEVSWFAGYEFRFAKYMRHRGTGEAWEDVREHADPGLRQALDELLFGLVWDGLHDEGVQVEEKLFAGDGYAWHSDLLLARPPQAMPALARAWNHAAPLLADLRGPFTAHVSSGFIDRFE
ncbi:hypothetical protein [Embleya sp. NBC_00896]|uniref:hypothetical protein n=1 Tax=Embleya sp. NBC_00896 TaxID=2975961 RepID=UPI00386C6B2C|nr:hypothetical protein OG928_00430 [Embleya sp. NBC_00896]